MDNKSTRKQEPIDSKRPYESPAIVHTEEIEARAAGCAKLGGDPACDPAQGGPGPVVS